VLTEATAALLVAVTPNPPMTPVIGQFGNLASVISFYPEGQHTYRCQQIPRLVVSLPRDMLLNPEYPEGAIFYNPYAIRSKIIFQFYFHHFLASI
jgi:hypothetical protein